MQPVRRGRSAANLAPVDVTTITEATDPRIDAYAGLRDPALRLRRESRGGDLASVFIAEGGPVVERALRAGCRMQSLLLDERRLERYAYLATPGAALYAADRPVIEAVTGFHVHRGVLACFERPALADPATVIANARRIAVLESINNHTNVGAIFRCAAALGVDAVLLCPCTCDPLYRRTLRVSMGEALSVPYARVARLPDGFAPIRAAFRRRSSRDPAASETAASGCCALFPVSALRWSMRA